MSPETIYVSDPIFIIDITAYCAAVLVSELLLAIVTDPLTGLIVV